MASGQKYNDDIKERAYALFDTNNNVEYVSRKLGVPESTLRGWKKRYEEEALKDPTLAARRQKYKTDFVKSAWRSINMAQALLERRLSRALENENLIDEMISIVKQGESGAQMSEQRRDELLSRMSELKRDDLGRLDLGRLVAILGTLYDKQALANREETEIVGGHVVTRFEDL